MSLEFVIWWVGIGLIQLPLVWLFQAIGFQDMMKRYEEDVSILEGMESAKRSTPWWAVLLFALIPLSGLLMLDVILNGKQDYGE